MTQRYREARQVQSFERWVSKAPLGKAYAWLSSVPGSLLFNTPAYKLHEELQLHPENRLLDIGCGRGSTLRLLASRIAFQARPVGVEVAGAMLELGHREAPGVDLVQASGTSLPLSDGVFDVVTCGYVARRLEPPELLALLQEIRRVLTPGGIALLWDFAPTRSKALNAFHNRLLMMGNGGPNLHTYTTLSAYALEAGFEWVSNAHLRPFLFPPIPRVSVLIGKAPIGWEPDQGVEGLTPDTKARSLIAGVTKLHRG